MLARLLPPPLSLCSGRDCCQGSSRALLPPLLPYMCPPPLSVQWPGLLPGLVESLVAATAAGDLKAVGGILATANSIFKRYRWEGGVGGGGQVGRDGRGVLAMANSIFKRWRGGGE